MRQRRTLATLAGTLLAPLWTLAASTSAADAGLVSPGQLVTVDAFDLTPPAGALLATKSTAFSIDYAAGVGSPAYPGALAGTLHSSVYRGGDGKLTFVYDVDLTSTGKFSGAAEGSDLRVGSFAGFATDVSGALDFEDLASASRSADGKQVRLRSDTPGLGGAPTLIVRTDATQYAADGRAGYYAADELSSPTGSSNTFFGTTAIDGVYRPASAAVPPPDGGPVNVVPLPPAAYSGLGVLLAMGMIVATRKYLGRVA